MLLFYVILHTGHIVVHGRYVILPFPLRRFQTNRDLPLCLYSLSSMDACMLLKLFKLGTLFLHPGALSSHLLSGVSQRLQLLQRTILPFQSLLQISFLCLFIRNRKAVPTPTIAVVASAATPSGEPSFDGPEKPPTDEFAFGVLFHCSITVLQYIRFSLLIYRMIRREPTPEVIYRYLLSQCRLL